MPGTTRIAVTQVWYDVEPGLTGVYGNYRYCLSHCYTALLDRKGLLPLAVMPVRNTSAEELLSSFDILVMTGGGDPSPSLFNRTNMGSRNPETARPLWDMDLCRAARNMGMPVFGICLGMQLMGIAGGVPLIQDIGSTVDGAVFHDGSAQAPVFHEVVIEKNSLLHSALGSRATVSSYHHQALESVPEGFVVSARSIDGMIEAIESSDGLAVGVQWHPERDGTGSSIIDAFLRMAFKL